MTETALTLVCMRSPFCTILAQHNPTQYNQPTHNIQRRKFLVAENTDRKKMLRRILGLFRSCADLPKLFLPQVSGLFDQRCSHPGSSKSSECCPSSPGPYIGASLCLQGIFCDPWHGLKWLKTLSTIMSPEDPKSFTQVSA